VLFYFILPHSKLVSYVSMYARLSPRIRALLIDSLVASAVFIVSILVVSAMGFENKYLAAAIAFIPIFSIEPLMLSIKGGSIGHLRVGIRVRSASTGKPLNILVAYLRSIIKLLLGMPSLIFVLTTRKHQAIHDLLTNAVVVVHDAQNKPSYESMSERVKDESYDYPGVLRRLAVIFTYLILALIAVSFLAILTSNENCTQYKQCSKIDSIISYGIAISYWLALFSVPYLGWGARLFGARKVKRS